MLSVQQVRLRFIFGCLLVSASSISKGALCKYTAHLLRRTAKNSPRRISIATDGGGSMQQRDLHFANLAGKKCTWKYISYRACGTFLLYFLYLYRLFAKAYRYALFPNKQGKRIRQNRFKAQNTEARQAFEPQSGEILLE